MSPRAVRSPAADAADAADAPPDAFPSFSRPSLPPVFVRLVPTLAPSASLGEGAIVALRQKFKKDDRSILPTVLVPLPLLPGLGEGQARLSAGSLAKDRKSALFAILQ